MLRILHGVSVPLNATQIAQLAHLTKVAVGNALSELSAMGLVQSTPVGRSKAHMLVRDNVYVERIVSPVFEAEHALPSLIEEELVGLFANTTVSIVLFGSQARGEQGEDSDVDVVLVSARETHAAVERILDEQSVRFRRRFGATLSALVYTTDEAGELHLRAPALFESISRDAIVVAGVGPKEWAGLAEEGRDTRCRQS